MMVMFFGGDDHDDIIILHIKARVHFCVWLRKKQGFDMPTFLSISLYFSL